MRKGLWIAIAGLGAAGCATFHTPIVAIGGGRYEITAESATALTSGASEKSRALTAASAFCRHHGGNLNVVNEQTTNGRAGGWRGVRKASADVIFTCNPS